MSLRGYSSDADGHTNNKRCKPHVSEGRPPIVKQELFINLSAIINFKKWEDLHYSRKET